MPAVYVYALSDAPVGPWQDAGRRIESVAVEDIFAVCERRAEAPALTEAELLRQHAIVQRIAGATSAILPARFGSLVDLDELGAIVRQRREAMVAALDLVRDCAQMTLRVPPGPALAAASAPSTGREYLQRRKEEAWPAVAADSEKMLRAVSAWVRDERRKANEGVVTVYHLVKKADVAAYQQAIDRAANGRISVSGPWPPFAFAPEF